MAEKRHNTIYQYTNLKNGMIYIGQHRSDYEKLDDDPYTTSGRDIKLEITRSPDDFKREILFNFPYNWDKMNNKEGELVTEEFVARKDTYNLIIGGVGRSSKDMTGSRNPMFEKVFTQKHRDRISIGRTGIKCSKATKLKMSLSKLGEKNPNYNVPMSQEQKDKIGKANKGRIYTQEQKDKRGGEGNSMWNKNHSLNTIEKMSISKRGKNNPNYGKKWYHNPNTNKLLFLTKNDIIPTGFIKGRKKRT